MEKSGLLSLPKEIVIEILSYLKPKKIFESISVVCRPFHEIISKDVGFWKVMCFVLFFRKKKRLNHIYKVFSDEEYKEKLTPDEDFFLNSIKYGEIKRKRYLYQAEHYRIEKTSRYQEGLSTIRSSVEHDTDQRKRLLLTFNIWKRIFFVYHYGQFYLFKQELDKRINKHYMENHKRKTEVSPLFMEYNTFCDLSCRACRELKTFTYGCGDFELSGYVFAKTPEKLKKMLDGYDIDQVRYFDTEEEKETFDHWIRTWLHHSPHEMKRYEELLKENDPNKIQPFVKSLIENIEKQNPFIRHELILNPDTFEFEYKGGKYRRRKKNETDDDDESSKERIWKEYRECPYSNIPNFLEFVWICIQKKGLRFVNTSDFKLLKDGGKSWSYICHQLMKGFDLKPHHFIPFYEKKIENALVLREDGNQCGVCVQTKNNYYYLMMYTS